jgi:phage repressor protein C with HTH and peptisase S24 domain
MKPIAEIRRENLGLLRERFGSWASLNTELGRDRRDSTLSQIYNKAPDSKTGRPRQMGDVQARDIEALLKIKEPLWMDIDHGGQPPKGGRAAAQEPVKSDEMFTNAPKKGSGNPHAEPEYAGRVPFIRRVPVVGTAKLGENGWYEEISAAVGGGDGFVDVFTEDPNAYVLRVKGDSMHPAIRDGWYVLVEPNGTPTAGEFVVVKLTDGRKMVKELLYERRDSIAVISVNGDKRITLDRTEVEAIQPVASIVSPSKWKPE